MPTYCIGDVHGCYHELKELLRIINYKEQNDHLWFVGDVVGRGPKSLEALRSIKNLPNVQMVLGNHELHLLNICNGDTRFQTYNLEQILTAQDASQLIDWLRTKPLLHYSTRFNSVLTHAGIYPGWSLAEAMGYAKEAEAAIRADNYWDFLKNIYSNLPTKWSNDLTGWDRLRFITNAFTRMRFCNLYGDLEFKHTGNADTPPHDFYPWFKIPWHKSKNVKIIFGHWATLNGHTGEKNIEVLDTGCVRGGSLTALRLEDGVRFGCKCSCSCK